ASPVGSQATHQNFGELNSKLLRRPPAFLPKGLSAFVTINGTQGGVIEPLEEVSDDVEGALAKSGHKSFKNIGPTVTPSAMEIYVLLEAQRIRLIPLACVLLPE